MDTIHNCKIIKIKKIYSTSVISTVGRNGHVRSTDNVPLITNALPVDRPSEKTSKALSIFYSIHSHYHYQNLTELLSEMNGKIIYLSFDRIIIW